MHVLPPSVPQEARVSFLTLCSLLGWLHVTEVGLVEKCGLPELPDMVSDDSTRPLWGTFELEGRAMPCERQSVQA